MLSGQNDVPRPLGRDVDLSGQVTSAQLSANSEADPCESIVRLSLPRTVYALRPT